MIAMAPIRFVRTWLSASEALLEIRLIICFHLSPLVNQFTRIDVSHVVPTPESYPVSSMVGLC